MLALASCASGTATGPVGSRPDGGFGPSTAPSTVLSPGDSVPTTVPTPSSTTATPPSALVTEVPDAPGGVIEHGSRQRPVVALTFDADMTPAMLRRLRAGTVRSAYDAEIVAELRETGTPATIFTTGLWATEYADVLRGLAADPLFEIENHSYTHAAFHGPCYGLDVLTAEDAKLHEVVDTAQTLAQRTGRAPQYFRFPGGCYEPSDVALVHQAGELPVGWDVVSGDPFQHDPAVIVRKVLDNVRPGSIVVLHLNGAPNAPATATALREIIPGLRARGLLPVTLQQLLI